MRAIARARFRLILSLPNGLLFGTATPESTLNQSRFN
jgi:hypothetical protein